MKNYIILSDSQPLFKDSINTIIHNEINKNYICKYCCSYKILEQNIKDIDGKIKLIILGTNLRDIENINTTISGLVNITKAPILVVTTINNKSYAIKTINSGATSYAVKTMSHKNCKEIIEKTILGEQCIVLEQLNSNDITSVINSLTTRQYEILTEISKGLLNKQIAYKLKITESTVKIHVSSILLRLSVNNRTEAVARFYREAK